VLMALACTATPTPTPTPTGPMYPEEEAIAVLKANLQAKTPARIRPSGRVSCLMSIDGDSVTWSAKYDDNGHRWNVTAWNPASEQYPATWSVYERSGAIVAMDGNFFGQVC
jgi:hypothetical protein